LNEHNVGDLLLSYTFEGKAVLGVIRKEEISPIDFTLNLYDIMWLEKEEDIIVSGYYTYSTVKSFKKNLFDYLYNYDKT